MFLKIFEKITKPLCGKIKWQNFFASLYGLSLIGINIGQGANIENNGEIFVLEYIKKNEKTLTNF